MAPIHGSADDGTWTPLPGAGGGSNWLGAALFLGFAGALHEIGSHAWAFALGWLGGCVLATALVAPRIRRFGRYTLTEFLGARYGNGATRLLGVGVLLVVLCTFLTAQLYGIAIVISYNLPVDFDIAALIGLGCVLACAMLADLRFVRRIPVPLVVIFVATIVYVVAATSVRSHVAGWLITAIRPDEDNITMHPLDVIDTAALFACLLIGGAALPQIRMRRITTQLARTTGLAVAWDLLFLLPVFFFAPAFTLAAHFGVGGDTFVLEAPWQAGVPPELAHMVAIGALAILLLIATRLLRAIFALFTGDKPREGSKARLVLAIAGTILIGVAAAYAAALRPASILTMMAWGLSIAAAGLFAPLVLGLWWKRTSTLGATFGIAAGFGVCLFYLIGTQYFPDRFAALFGSATWWGIDNIAAGMFGIPVALAVTVLVSLVTPAPSPEMQEFVASLRRPRSTPANSAHGRE